MNTFLKFTLTACLVSLGFTMFAQTPVINGSAAAEIHGVYGKSVKFQASGCPSPLTYSWTYTNSQQPVEQPWQTTTGDLTSENVSVVNTVGLGVGESIDLKAPYVYKVQCKAVGSAASGPTATVTIRMWKTTDKPMAINTIARVCSNIDNMSTGSVTLRAMGCLEGTYWRKPNGDIIDQGSSNTLLVDFSDAGFQQGFYKAVCKFPSATEINTTTSVTPELYSAEATSSFIERAYRSGQVIISGTGKPRGTDRFQDICQGETNTLSWKNLQSAHYNKFNFTWLRNGFGGVQSVSGAPNTANVSAVGEYYLRVDSKDVRFCGTEESNKITISIIDLVKPSIAGNLSYCLEGATTLSVDEVALTQSGKGYLGVTKPATYTWFVDGVADATLGNSSSIKLNKNVKVSVSYVSNANCASTKSSEVAVVNYERPATPTITAKTKLGFCAGTPIAAVLESSKNTTGGTIFEWSTAANTQAINIDKAGLYTVKVIDDNGCYSESSAPTEVKVLPLPAAPVIAANSATIFCTKSDAGAINAVSITATSANDVIWNTTFQGKVLADVKTSGTYSATAKDANGCISVVSNSVKVVNQPNPGLGSASIAKEGVYNLKALNFPASDGSGTAGDFEWKFGSSVLNSKVAVAKVLSGGDYTARRKYNYTIDGTTLTCFTDAVRYSYGVDPEFKGVAIYPNPITGSKVNIQTLEDWSSAEVTIYDMVGRPVYSGRLGSTELANELNVNGLGNGIYIVQIKGSGEKSFISKVIVNK
jgi:hypothetical protein